MVKRLHTVTRFQVAVLLLFLAGLLVLPVARTQSKYVWQEDIQLTLKIHYNGQSIASARLDTVLPEQWTLQLTHLQATRQVQGLVLTAEPGYTLPESFTVQIGLSEYVVHTSGQNNPDGITFAPQTGLLSIDQALILENQGGVTVIAAGVQAEAALDQTEVDSVPPVQQEPETSLVPPQAGQETESAPDQSDAESGGEAAVQQPAPDSGGEPAAGEVTQQAPAAVPDAGESQLQEAAQAVETASETAPAAQKTMTE